MHVTVPSNSSSTETSAGLFSIQVTDNGSGIAKDDLELLCERHATSKLRNVGDLRSVGTFGFRGEALASCSQVARVEVITRSRDEEQTEEVAWKALYLAGKLIAEPTPVAGNFGTIINVKDLFYGNRVRREALLNSSEEYQKIVQVIQAYALNQAGRCAFILTKRRDRVELQTSLTDSSVQIVGNLWGAEIGGSLLPFSIDTDSKLGIEGGSGGWASRTTFHKLKSPQVIIFLNDRLIEHVVLRRSILQAFSIHLPTSPPAHPFVYLKLGLKGNRVDVNVHPSKRQVFFLDEEDIVKRLLAAIDTAILQRQYESQSLKPIIIAGPDRDDPKRAKVDKSTAPSVVPKISALYPSQRVLTDHRNHRIDSFLFHAQSQTAQKSPQGAPSKWTQLDRKENNPTNTGIMSNDSDMSISTINDIKMIPASSSSLLFSSSQPESPLPTATDNSVDETPLIEANKTMSDNSLDDTGNLPASLTLNTSVDSSVDIAGNTSINHDAQSPQSISVLISKSSNDQLSRLLKSSLVVGLIDSRWCLLQSGTNLLLCDMDRLNYEMFFSVMAVAGCGKESFEVEIGVKGLFEDVNIGLEAVEVIKCNSQFFCAQFGIIFEPSIDDIILKRIPSVLPGQRCPSSRFLKTFLQRLCLLLDTKESTVMRELALLYSLVDTEEWADWEEYVKFVLLNGYRDARAKFTLRDEFKNFDGGSEALLFTGPPPLQIITNTETLYKSFERC